MSRTTNGADLDLIRALLDNEYVAEASSIGAAANLKKTRLRLKIDQRADEVHSQDSLGSGPKEGKLSILSYEALTVSSGTYHHGEYSRQFGRYKSPRRNIDAQVMVEWKAVDKTLEDKLIVRIQKLTFLMCNNSDPSFHTLPCLGYLVRKTEESFNEYAYVFKTAPGYRLGQQAPRIRTLASLLRVPHLPSLTDRTRIAHVLAEALKQLHTCGWLHKSIHADNIIFVDHGDRHWEHGQSSGPYVAGFEYTRADTLLEITEDAPSDAEQSLYRHPESLGQLRASYRKEFDLFALGCVLLEIALWTSLKAILFHFGSDTEGAVQNKISGTLDPDINDHQQRECILKGNTSLLNRDRLRSLLDHVAFHAGDIYRASVELCFFPEVDRIEGEDGEASVRTQVRIAGLLSERKLSYGNAD